MRRTKLILLLTITSLISCAQKRGLKIDEEQIEPKDTIAIPAPIDGEISIDKRYYSISYNSNTKCPNWVAWHLTAEHTDGPYPRLNQFHEEEELPAPRATLEDYKRSGWSRGHMCPAGDNKWDAEAMYETFSLANVCPQNVNLNSGLWNSIEMDCRLWARRFGDIYIVCGPVYLRREHETIGYNKVYVPEAFFKVVLCLNGTPKGFGFIVRNTDGNKKRDLYYNSIDQVERITGYDFFPALPDSIENEVEAKLDMNLWY
jgi:endonuclease G